MNPSTEKKNDNSNAPQRKDITIVINGTPHVVPKEELSFQEVVALAQLATGSNVSHTITYRRGQGNKPEGSLVEGESVKLKEGMIFNATATDKS